MAYVFFHFVCYLLYNYFQVRISLKNDCSTNTILPHLQKWPFKMFTQSFKDQCGGTPDTCRHSTEGVPSIPVLLNSYSHHVCWSTNTFSRIIWRNSMYIHNFPILHYTRQSIQWSSVIETRRCRWSIFSQKSLFDKLIRLNPNSLFVYVLVSNYFYSSSAQIQWQNSMWFRWICWLCSLNVDQQRFPSWDRGLGYR